ncbi:MAG: helix-turn-helix transcriptional regulator [Lachnospiraceae bacterium]|nr:helix-turn-helix transcriptional regulator [Lachnospiraceae bacterium]
MHSSSNTLVPERLKSVRERLNLSKAEAARKIGLTAASYVRYESGDRCPSSQVLMTIAEKLGTSTAFLSGETDDISPDVISISKNNEPLLFELINDAQSADDMTLQRLLSYYHQLKAND